MSCTVTQAALDIMMYQMILKHYETMPLSGKSFDGKWMYILVYTIFFGINLYIHVYTSIYSILKYILVYRSIYKNDHSYPGC